MSTVIRSLSKEIVVGPEGPATIIAERINPTGRPELREALQRGDLEMVRLLAIQQEAAGADMIDVNVNAPDVDERALLAEAVAAVAEVTTLPLCIDSPNPRSLQQALEAAPGKPLVNSVNGSEASLKQVLPIVQRRGAAVIALTLDDEGIPPTAEGRLGIARRIIDRAVRAGIPPEDVLIDPVVMTVGADPQAATVTLRAIQLIRAELGATVVLGASNVSHGLPEREVLNAAFLGLAVAAGASAFITDVREQALLIRGLDLLAGRDAMGRGYLSRARQLANAD